ncbi:hypothetical protein TNCV_2369221 [Trichonephila clavipes]|nr:hypothetical protein TNCV_2369221 [Trichonephila clavipes]
MNIKFFDCLRKSTTKTKEMLKHTLSRTQLYEWHLRFREGRESVEDGGSSRRLQISLTTEKVSAIVCEDKFQTMTVDENENIFLPHPPYSPDLAPCDFRLRYDFRYVTQWTVFPIWYPETPKMKLREIKQQPTIYGTLEFPSHVANIFCQYANENCQQLSV